MSEDRYEPYEYGRPEEPQFEEPDILETDSESGDVDIDESEPQVEVQEKQEAVERYDYDYHYPPTSNEPKKQKGSNGFLKALGVVGLAVCFGFIASVVFKGSNYLIDKFYGEFITGDTMGNISNNDDNQQDEIQDIGSTQIVTSDGTVIESAIADVAASVMPSVVSITNISIQEVRDYIFGGTTQYEVPSSGSGIIVGQNDKELLIATNNHVVEGSETLTVTFADGASANAQIKGTDSDIDLAIIAIVMSDLESTTKEAIKVATLGNSDLLRVGETTIAIGNALGYGQSVTAGIASALGATIEGYEGKLIQTDAAINPGNSGGALVNASGEVIGINTAKIKDESVEGMGYAIPISDVLDVLKDLMNKETRTKVPEAERGTIGIEILNVTAETSERYNIPEGVYVNGIVEGGAADDADLPLYCVITAINGHKIDDGNELKEQLEYYRAGETVELTIMVQNRKGYEKETIKITLKSAK